MIGNIVQSLRKSQSITQERLSEISGVGLRFIRDLEQGKATVRLDKVNQVLGVFGYRVGAVPLNSTDTILNPTIRTKNKFPTRRKGTA
jgi:y4mF family transcriptional regulator